jgi:branched-chain amino acid transport system substrate-binding protein
LGPTIGVFCFEDENILGVPMKNSYSRRRRFTLVAGVAASVTLAVVAAIATSLSAQEPIKIGHVAALSGGSAQSGEAITRGLSLAIEEINASGGVLGGRKIELIQRDDESVPPKGVVAARELISKEKVVALFGGIDSPVALATVPVVNKEKVPYMAVWAAGTGITRNGADPNFVFRVSAVDVLVDVKLLDYANKKFGSTKPGLLLVNNPWGASNEAGLLEASKTNPVLQIVGVEKFENADVDMTAQLTRLKEKGADTVIIVGNAAPGAQLMKSRERMGWTVPIVSHWGISGGRFPELAGPTAGDAHFVQTYSFFGKQRAVGERVLAALKKKYPQIKGPEDIFSPVGTANAYDAMHLLVKAIAQAGATQGDKIRDALENLSGKYEGLIKTYDHPFSKTEHDALGPGDYIMVRYEGEKIVPTQ